MCWCPCSGGAIHNPEDRIGGGGRKADRRAEFEGGTETGGRQQTIGFAANPWKGRYREKRCMEW